MALYGTVPLQKNRALNFGLTIFELTWITIQRVLVNLRVCLLVDINTWRSCEIVGWLVVWLQFYIFPEILGTSSSQLTNSVIFFRTGWPWPTNQLVKLPDISTFRVIPGGIPSTIRLAFLGIFGPAPRFSWFQTWLNKLNPSKSLRQPWFLVANMWMEQPVHFWTLKTWHPARTSPDQERSRRVKHRETLRAQFAMADLADL